MNKIWLVGVLFVILFLVGGVFATTFDTNVNFYPKQTASDIDVLYTFNVEYIDGPAPTLKNIYLDVADVNSGQVKYIVDGSSIVLPTGWSYEIISTDITGNIQQIKFKTSNNGIPQGQDANFIFVAHTPVDIASYYWKVRPQAGSSEFIFEGSSTTGPIYPKLIDMPNTINPNNVSRGDNVSFSINVNNIGGSDVTLDTSSKISFTDGVNTYEAYLSSPTLVAVGNITTISFNSNIVPPGMTQMTYDPTLLTLSGASYSQIISTTNNKISIDNNAPVANDDSVLTNEDNDVTINVLSNDYDPNGNAISVTSISSNPTNGTATIDLDGNIVYSPNTNFNGTDSFIYEISDGSATDTANVLITITAVNDSPVANTGGPYIANQGVAVTFDASASTDPDGINQIALYEWDINGDLIFDTSSGSPTVVHTYDQNGIYTVNLKITDINGATNIATTTATITYVDKIKPVITLIGSDLNVEFGLTYIDQGATASDNFDGDITASIISNSDVNTNALGMYNVTDSSGNVADQVTRKVNVIDTTKPVITLVGANPQIIEVGSLYVELSAVANDNYDGNLDTNITIDSTNVNTSKVGAYVVTYNVSDSQGNVAIQVVRDVNVVDTTAPDLNVPVDFNVEATSPLGAVVNYSVSTFDVSGNVLVVCLPASGSIFSLGITNISCTATDDSNNIITKNFNVNVVDTTVPNLIVPGNQVIEATSPYGAIYGFVVSSTDIVDTNVGIVCDHDNNFPLGVTTVSCIATDDFNNFSTGLFDVNVVDTTPPVITAPGTITVDANANSVIVNFSATANDIVDGDVIVNCTPASGTDFNLGTTLVSCNAVDSRGNSADSNFNIIIQDVNYPILTIPSDITEEANIFGGAIVNFIVTATDEVDGSLTVTCDHNSGDLFSLGTTTVSCSATDLSNNTSDANFSITVIDTTGPDMNLLGINPQIIELGFDYIEFGATANDIYDGNLDTNITIDSTDVNVFVIGLYKVIYSVVDSQGNDSNIVRDVNVVDTINPIIDSFTANLVASNVELLFSASDINGSGVAAYYVSIDNNSWNMTTDNNYSYLGLADGSYTFYLKASDNAGNISDINTISVTITTVITTATITTGGTVSGGNYRCTAFTYSDWGFCVDGQQTRTVLSQQSAPCLDGRTIGATPVLTQSCEIAEPNTSPEGFGEEISTVPVTEPVEDLVIETTPDGQPQGPTGIFGLGEATDLGVGLIGLLAIIAIIVVVWKSRK